MNFTEAVKTCYSKYATFTGRATRSEYWWFYLFFLLVIFVFGFLGEMSEIFNFAGVLFMLGTLIPSIAAGVRRLHDTDKSGWWLLIGIVPFIGLLLIYFLAISGTPGDNRFGPASTN